jgi:cell division protein FtsI (penicillin-binding protein 3)
MDLRKIILSRYGLLLALLFMFSLGIMVKVVIIQLTGSVKWGSKLKYIEDRTEVIYGNRGNICSSDGGVLATSVPSYQIRFDLGAPSVRAVFKQEVDDLAASLSRLYGDRSKAQFKSELEKAYKNKTRYYLVHPRKINYDELQRARKFPIFERGKYKGGFMPEQEYVRVMPHGKLAYRTIGLLSKGAEDGSQGNVGISGIEKKYEDYLQGDAGIALQQNLSGRWVNIISDEPDNGKDVITTINLYLQDVVESSLKKQLELSQAEYGLAVLMDVETGKIRAIANLGHTGNGYQEIYNYALGHEGCTEPGSTFKLVSMMIAMEDGKVDTSDVFDVGEGKWKLYDQIIYDSDYGKAAHGKMTMKQIFERSSNVGVAKIIHQSYKGHEKDFIDRVYGLGFNKKLDLGFQGEAKPYVKYPTDNNWWGTSLAWISYGYEIQISPLQMLTFYNAVANDGKMMKPMFVEAIAENGVIEEEFSTHVMKYSICSDRTLRKMKKMLEGVVENGTASGIYTSRYKIAGKTGTSKIADRNKGYAEGMYRASFAGYFPADKPKYSCIVVISEPKGQYSGAYVAAPVFRDIADCIYGTDLSLNIVKKDDGSKKKLPSIMNGLVPETKTVCKELGIRYKSPERGADWVSTVEGEKSVEMKSRKLVDLMMPNVLGMGATDAVYLVEKSGLKAKINGVGRVLKQSPQPGTRCQKGQRVNLILS